MKKSLLALATMLFAFTAFPAASQTQTVCGDRSEFVFKLQNGYAEKPVSLGLTLNGSMIEVFASDNGTFSVLVTKPGGTSCMVAAGENWQNVPNRKADIKL